MSSLLRRGDFRLLLVALVLSMFGDRALLLVNGIWVKDLTGSSAQAGLTILAIAAPSILAPLFGVLVDKARRRPFLVGLNLAAAVIIVPLLVVRGAGDVWIIFAVSFAYGIAMIMNDAAVGGLLKVMLDDEQLAGANGVIQTMREGLRLVAPLAGAGLFAAFGGPAVVILDMATFLIGAGALALLRVRETRRAGASHHLAADMTAGMRHLFGVVALRRVVLASGVALLVIGFFETVVFAVVDHGLHRAPSFVGALITLQGVGAVIGGSGASAVIRRVGEQITAAVGFVLVALGMPLTMFSSLPPVAAGMIVAGAGLPLVLVALNTLMQRATPNALLGRVGTTVEVLVGGPQTVSIGLGAVLITVIDYRILLAVIGAVVLASGVFLLPRRHDGTSPELHQHRSRHGTSTRSG